MTTPTNVPPTADDKLLSWAVPINRSGWAIAAGYVALFSIPFVFLGPVAIALGIVALVHLKKNPGRQGRGRAWFAIGYGALATAALLYLLSFAFTG